MISWRTTGLSSPMSNVPPTSSRPSSSWVATGATMPGSRSGVGSVTSRWPLTRSQGRSRSRPSSTGGQPGGEDHRARLHLPRGRVHAHDPVAADRDAGRGDPGGHRGQRGGQPGQRAQRVDPALVVDQRARHRQREPGDELGHVVGLQPLHRGRLMRGQGARVGGQADPVHVHQPDPARRGLLQLGPLAQAGPGQVHEGLRVAPLVDLGSQQPRGAAGGPGAQVAGLDEQHRAQASLVAGGRGRHPGDPAADDEQIGARLRDRHPHRGRAQRAPLR